MGYKFRIEYKTGASNKAADALFRRDMEFEEAATATMLALVCHPRPGIMTTLRNETQLLPELVKLRADIEGGRARPGYALVDGLIYFGHRIVVAKDSAAKEDLLFEHHSTPLAGHPGVDRTFRRLAASFFWAAMQKDVKRFVETCFECQTTTYSTQKPTGVLQPLPVPSQVWEDVSMDFITSLPQSKGYTIILVAVDRLSKYAHFAPLPARFDPWRVANFLLTLWSSITGFRRR